MSKSKSSTRPALQVVPSPVAGAAHAARGDANARALTGLEDRRREQLADLLARTAAARETTTEAT